MPGLAEFARGGRPAVPANGDGNPWESGLCWLYCGQWTRVMWIGPVTVAAATAPMYACAPCIRKLNELVWNHILLVDTGIGRTELAVPTDNGPPVLEASRSSPRQRARHRRSTVDRWTQGWRGRVRDREQR
ncbi:hypothetical protein AB0D10_01015 [Kitasatospora sp. NPDC048545]|uniref:hypothetical protein n=1 Tax=Kitasatospora sp. NPDC048545 TaxID=3157208 RepID=UPI0033C08698